MLFKSKKKYIWLKSSKYASNYGDNFTNTHLIRCKIDDNEVEKLDWKKRTCKNKGNKAPKPQPCHLSLSISCNPFAVLI